MPTVLLTRPYEASENLARKFDRHGYKSIIEPLLVIEPLKTPRPDISGTQAVMITSSNALETAGGQEIPVLFGLPCFCVGERTAAKAREAGFCDVRGVALDGAGLAQLIAGTLPDRKASILHICGQDIDSKAQDELTRFGHRVTGWTVYAAHPVPELTAHTADMFRRKQIGAVTVFSIRTAEALKRLITRGGLEACCEAVIAIGLSEAVTDALKPLAWKRLAAASEPTEDAMIECLRQIHPVS